MAAAPSKAAMARPPAHGLGRQAQSSRQRQRMSNDIIGKRVRALLHEVKRQPGGVITHPDSTRLIVRSDTLCWVASGWRGEVSARAICRRPGDRQWQAEYLRRVRGLPWAVREGVKVQDPEERPSQSQRTRWSRKATRVRASRA